MFNRLLMLYEIVKIYNKRATPELRLNLLELTWDEPEMVKFGEKLSESPIEVTDAYQVERDTSDDHTSDPAGPTILMYSIPTSRNRP